MIPLGLTAAERAAFDAALVAPKRDWRTRIAICDQDEQPVAEMDATDRVTAGGVTVRTDLDANPSESTPPPTHHLDLTILDPEVDLPYDLDLDHAVSLKTPVSVRRELWVPDIPRWVPIPVFFGPVRRYRRAGPEVTIGADGLEYLATDPHLLGERIERGPDRRVADAIRAILAARGVTRFAFDAPSDTLDERLTLDRLADPWPEALILARDIDRQLFFDGAGTARLRQLPSSPVFTFRTGRGGTVLSDVGVDKDDEGFANMVRVRWESKTAKGAVDVAPEPSHSLSPQSLVRGGKDREVWRILDTRLKKESKALQRGKRELGRTLTIPTTATFDARAIYHLEPGDLCAVEDPDLGLVEFRLEQFTLPLGSASMPVGYNRRIRYPIKRYRIRKHKKRIPKKKR